MPTIAELGSPKRNFDPQGNAFLRIVQNWGNELIQNFRINLLKNKSLASKSLYQDIIPEIKPKANGANLKIKMLDYWQFVENGRQPTRANSPSNPTLQKSIEEWIVYKGIPTPNNQDRRTAIKSLAYVIARKIHRNGTKPRPFVAPALNDKMMQSLSDRIGQYIADTLTK